MSTSPSRFGPTPEQLQTWKPLYFSEPRLPITPRSGRGQAKGGLVGSPLVMGSRDNYYEPHFNYWDQTGERFMTYPNLLTDYYKIAFLKNGAPDLKRGSGYEFSDPDPGKIRASSPSGQIFGTRLYDGYQSNAVSDRINYPESSPKIARPTSEQISAKVLNDIVTIVNDPNQGPFSPLVKAAPHGFLFVESIDREENGGELWDDQDYVKAHGTSFNTYHYRRAEQGPSDPLDDPFDNFYGRPGSAWGGKVLDEGGFIGAGSGFWRNNIGFSRNLNLTSDSSVPRVYVLGPISDISAQLGDGNNIFVASPAMTPLLHSIVRSSTNFNNQVFASWWLDTVAYPSPVGAFGSNTLSLGNGNNLVYYDSSFRSIDAGSGNNVFIPSFGSFNWSIDWVSGWHKDAPEVGIAKRWLLDGKQLISPMPWDKSIVNPIDGTVVKPNKYVEVAKAFAADPKRDSHNYYYTISTYNEAGASFSKTWLNGELPKSDDPITTYNPVNRLGGVTLKAKGGNNVFYGFDPRLWDHLHEKDKGATTTALKLPSDQSARAAQHQWNAMNMIGGRGNNIFNLGNVIDDITSNSLFYNGNYSYRISLTHEDIFNSSVDVNNQGLGFANATDPVTGQPLTSTVNLTLKADPTTIEVLAQQAEGEKDTRSEEWSAWNGGINLLSKAIGNTSKINEDFVKYSSLALPGDKPWVTTSPVFQTLVRAVPFVDTALAISGAVLGIVNLFKKSKPVKPPQEEIKALYLEQPLDQAFKAVLINDWHPGTKINIMLPPSNTSAWGSLTFEVNNPNPQSGRNTGSGVYLNLNQTTSSSNTNTGNTKDFPLVVLENVGKPSDNFGYYSYDFESSDGISVALASNFKEISANNFALFGRLPAPESIEGTNGKILSRADTNFPIGFQHRSPNDFDMRNDTDNYSNFITGKDFYSKYYFNNVNDISGDVLKTNIRSWTSNISIEYDSRSNGYYWQPVLKVDYSNPDLAAITDPSRVELDYEKSKLWIETRDPVNGRQAWTSFSYGSFATNTQAYRYSLLASTFYYVKGSEGDQLITSRIERDAMLKQFQELVPDLSSVNQESITDLRQRLLLLQQIKSVTESTRKIGLKSYKGILVGFDTADIQNNTVESSIFIYRDGATVRAVEADSTSSINETEPTPGNATRLTTASTLLVSIPTVNGATSSEGNLLDSNISMLGGLPGNEYETYHSPWLQQYNEFSPVSSIL